MDSFIEYSNQWGGNFVSTAWPMLWQSSLLIAALFALDVLFRRKLRASVRYALWLVVLLKLCLPPSLALPTSMAWWLHPTPPPVVAKPELHYTVTYDNAPLPEVPQTSAPVYVPPKPAMNLNAWLFLLSVSVSSTLLLWLLVRWWQITRQVRRAKSSERLAALGDEVQKCLGLKFKVQIKLATNSMSPAVCGLFRPAILIPPALADHFSDAQLRAVLLHELIHLRRRDVWVNFWQALLQIIYWWHPLVWVANARIRRAREEAVDDAVMLALREEADHYAPTLLEVAKLALNRPRVSLGLVGIMESRSALRSRIERLVDFRAPRHAGLTLVSLLGILAFTAVAVPMGEAPGRVADPNFRSALQALKQRGGIPEPEVVTVINKEDAVNRLDETALSSWGNGNGSASSNADLFPSTNSDKLFMRTFRVDGNAVANPMWNDSGFQTNSVSDQLRNFFAELGVDFSTPKGKSLFYNDRLGTLFVKATEDDLDTIERAISALNQVPPQIHIKARFLEVPKGTLARFSNLLNLTNSAAAGRFAYRGILNEANAEIILRTLQFLKGVEELAEPEVTTHSGRQTQMRTTQNSTVITNLVFIQSVTGGLGSVETRTEQVETGPILDVVPYLLSDGYTINLTVIPSFNKFLGYVTRSADHFSIFDLHDLLPAVSPKFSLWQVTATLNLWDGQTLVLGGLPEQSNVINQICDDKPKHNGKELLVLITATIVDAAGNRVHSPEQMSFARTGIPPQTPQK